MIGSMVVATAICQSVNWRRKDRPLLFRVNVVKLESLVGLLFANSTLVSVTVPFCD